VSKFSITVTHEDGTKEYLHSNTYDEAEAIAQATGAANYIIKPEEDPAA
jgi:hypothetical protein